MRSLCLVLVASIGLVASAEATPGGELMAPIRQFIDAFNKGDNKSAAAAFAPKGLAIIDEVAPHVWQGVNAFQVWSKDLAAHDQKAGDTDGVVTLGEATRQIADGDRGYVVVPAVYTYKERGVAMRERAQMTFALERGSGGWLIAGWTWVGTSPQQDVLPAK
jgi:hypothetical protein